MVIRLLHKTHVILVQDVLPIGMAMTKRVWHKGLKDVLQVFTHLESPITQLRQEGNGAAQLIRDQLDIVLPGFGNPTRLDEVSEDENNKNITVLSFKMKKLNIILTHIDQDINLLSKYLEDM